MEQETITRKGGEVIITPVEELSDYEMADIQINTDDRSSIVIKGKDGYDIVTLHCINGIVDRAVFWGCGARDLKHISWFTHTGNTVSKRIDRKNLGGGSVTYLKMGESQ